MLGTQFTRNVRVGAVVCGVVVFATSSMANADAPDIPYGKGNVQRGKIKMPLRRGAAVPFELTVVETPQECTGQVDLSMRWDEADNSVQLKLRSEPNTLLQYPNVDRTEGVDYFPNQFFAEEEDVEGGRYQLWVISTSGPLIPFYYDFVTLELLGSTYDFDEPPLAIPVLFPTLYMVGSPMFQPNANGRVSMDWDFDYDSVTRGDRPEFSHHYVSFPPTNLCFANQWRLDQSLLRPYISKPLPASEARPWSDFLQGGFLFDITIEPPEYFMEPPLTTLTATYSGATAVGGAIPEGWQLDIEAAFAGLAPPIKPFPGRDTCEQYFEPVHAGAGINFCEG